MERGLDVTQRKEPLMVSIVLTVPDISCEHCVRTVQETLTPLDGVNNVTVDLIDKRVRVDYDEDRVDVEQMRQALAEEEYPVASTEK